MNTNPAYGTTSAVPMQGTQAGAYPTTGTTMHDPAHPPSALKGNMTSMMGKMTHNPTKEHDGNIMIANAAEQKAARFETKALEWESKGNTAKAQKNREKVRDLLLLLANLYLITRSFPFSFILRKSTMANVFSCRLLATARRPPPNWLSPSHLPTKPDPSAQSAPPASHPPSRATRPPAVRPKPSSTSARATSPRPRGTGNAPGASVRSTPSPTQSEPSTPAPTPGTAST